MKARINTTSNHREPLKRTGRWLAGGWMVVLTICLISPCASGSGDSGNPTPQTWQGVAQPGRAVDIGAPITGKINKLVIREGQTVATGDMLVQFDNSVAEAAVKAARLKVSQTSRISLTKIELDRATAHLNRLLKASESGGGVSEDDLNHARAIRDTAQANHQAATEEKELSKALLELEEQRLALTVIDAPFSGTITRLDVDAGAVVESAAPLLRLTNLQTLKIELHLPVTLYGQLECGQHYPIFAGSPVNRVIPAKLVYIEQIVDPGTKQFRCLFNLDNADHALPAGFTARLESTQIQTLTQVESTP